MRRDYVGERFGRLVVIAEAMGVHYPRGGGHQTHRRLTCVCDCGAEVVVQATHLTNGDAKSCGCLLRRRREMSNKWVGDAVGYHGMHDRIRAARGHAREYSCVRCGGVARDWAYRWDRDCSNERLDPRREKSGPFCTDVDHYDPMCKSCHNEFDRDETRQPLTMTARPRIISP